MKKVMFIMSGFLLVFSLVMGCSTVSQKSFNAKETAHIKKIAILAIPNPEQITIRNFGGLGALFGGLGAGIQAAASASENQEPLSNLLKQEKFSFPSEMERELISRLSRLGYSISFADGKRDNPTRPVGDYSSYKTLGVDAVLDVTNGVHFGYSNVNISDNEYRPHLDVLVQMVDLKSGDIVYSDQFIYGYKNPFMGGQQIPAPRTYFYKDAESVLTDGKRTVAGLRAGISTIADRISGQLARGR